MKTVIYARYSAGANQTEQSIEGQLRECNDYAKAHDMTIVGVHKISCVAARFDF